MGNTSATDGSKRTPALAPGAYAVGDKVGRISKVLRDVDGEMIPDIGGATDAGRLQDQNGDHYLVARLTRGLQVMHSNLPASEPAEAIQGWLLLVSGGSGSGETAEIASEVAVSALAERVLSSFPWDVGGDRAVSDVNRAAEIAFEKCQALITEYAEVCGIERGPGVTLTAAFVVWPIVHLLHVGDSRCYLQRSGTLIQLTVDQSDHRKQSDGGPPRPALKSLLANSQTAEDGDIEVEAHAHCLQRGDKLLLCTDGVTRCLATDDLADLLNSEHSSALVRAQRIVATAKARSGDDNLTAVVAVF